MKRDIPQVGKELRATFLQEIRKIDEKARTIEFVASTEAVDRYGDVIRVAGWKYDNYLKNPVFLWAHSHADPPIGKTVDLKIESKPPALVQTVEFADAATYPFADTIFRLYKSKFMRAVSVGFMPLEQPTPIKNDEGNMTGWEFTNQELLELSACPIPANQEALARAISGDAVRDDGESEDDLTDIVSEHVEKMGDALHKIVTHVNEAQKLCVKLAERLKDELDEDDDETSSSLSAVLNRTISGVEEKTVPKGHEQVIETIDELGEAFQPGEIQTLEELAEALRR